MQWYLAINGEPQGPYEESSLRSFVGEGLISRQTLCWNEDLLHWTPLAEAVPHLREATDFVPEIKPEPVVIRAPEVFRGPPVYPWTDQPRRVWPWILSALALHGVFIGVGFFLRQPKPEISLLPPSYEAPLEMQEVAFETPPAEPPPPAPPEPMTPPEPAPVPPMLSEPIPEPAAPPEFAESVPLPTAPVAPVPPVPAPPVVANVAPVPPAPASPEAHPVSTAAPAVSNNPEVARPSDYLSAPRVTYPYEARKRRQEGSVLLLVEFNEDGLPVRVEVEQSSGIALLDSTARQHVNRTFRFKPGSSRTVLVPITFSLK